MNDPDLFINTTPISKSKKRVKFKKDDADEEVHSKKRKIENFTDFDNSENNTGVIEQPNKKIKLENLNEEEEIHEHSDETQANDTIDWPQSDLRILVQNIEQSLPEKDNFAFLTRAEKLNWDDIAFNQYNGDECKRVWFLIQKRVRRFRLLSEILQDAKEWISKPWTNFYRSTRTNRHPDMPKRPLTGYLLFYVKKKDKLLAEFPGLEMNEVSKRMAQMYKNLTTEKREKYMQLAVAEKKAYEEKLAEFYRLHPDVPISEKSHSRTVETGPKKPSTPFSLFYKAQLHNFHSDSEMDRNTYKEQCKERWKSMTDQKKIIWIDSSLEEEEKYQEELKIYITQNPHFVSTPLKTVVTKEEKALKERLAGKPTKPPNSAYSLFSQIMLKSDEIKKIDPKGRMKALADRWKSCSDEEKKPYQEHCEQLMAQYKIDFANYIESLPESKRKEELQNNLPKRKVKKTEDPKNKMDEDNNKADDQKLRVEIKVEEEFIAVDVGGEIVENAKEKRKEEEKAKKKKEKVQKDMERMRNKEEEIRRNKLEEEARKAEEEEDKAIDHKNKNEIKQKKKKKKRNVPSSESVTKIFQAQPANPPVSGFALFSKRYHGKVAVETAWENLNKIEKKEYEGEVKKLKQSYIKEYEFFLKSLNKEQLTAFSAMKKMENVSTHGQHYKDAYSEAGELGNSDSSE